MHDNILMILPIATVVGCYLGFLLLLQVVVHRRALKAIRTISRNPDQITPEAFRARCVPILRKQLREIQQTVPRVRTVKLDMTISPFDQGWVPKFVPGPRLWLGPNYDHGPFDLEMYRAEDALNRDAEFLKQLIGDMQPEQMTFASIVRHTQPLRVEVSDA